MTPGQDAFRARYDVSRETLDRLSIYHDLLLRWNKGINLVARSTLDDVWTRHFRDSAQLLSLAPTGAESWADLGSGGGFPGMVIGIMAQDLMPRLGVVLIESDQRKAAFLRTVAREAGVDVAVLCQRAEHADPANADVVSARALAPLPALLGHVRRHLAPGGTALLQKGARYGAEVREALETWRFDCEDYPSETDAEAVILKIGGIERV